MTEDFLEAFNRKNNEAAEDGKVIRPFVGDPSLLPLAERQELVYKFQYLEETVESLALHYKLAPQSLATWLNKHDIIPKELLTEDQILDFEKEVTDTYKSIQTRLLGLTVLHSARAWQSLARSEEDLLASLENASKAVGVQDNPGHNIIASLVKTHEGLVNRHKIIQEGLDKAKDGGLFQAITTIERVIVKPKDQDNPEQEQEDE